MADKYPFNAQFRQKIIALCLQPGWFARYGTSLIRPDYFELEEERALVEAITEFYQTYRHAPRDEADLRVLLNGEPNSLVGSVFQPNMDFSLVKDEVIQWAKQQAAKIAILDSVDDVNRGQLEPVAERIREASRVGEDLSSPGIDLIDDVGLWLTEELWTDKVPTGWLHVDRHLEGGIGPGEMMIILGPSNRGKSMAMINVAYGAAGIGSGKNVVVFSHEMAAKVYAKRFAARMLHRFPTNRDIDAYKSELLDQARMLLPGKVRIIGGAEKMTTMQVEGHLRRLVDEGFVPDMVIDDYPDLLIPPKHRSERRFELSDIYEWFRSLGAPGYITDRGFPTVGASQSNRGSFDKEIITEKDVAEDINKVAISDVIIALCQTRKEADAERVRLYGAKVRDGKRGFMFDAKFLQGSQAIITTGISKQREEEEEF